MPLLINTWQRTDFPFSVMIRTGVLCQGAPCDNRVIYGGPCYSQMVSMRQALCTSLSSRILRDLQTLDYVGEHPPPRVLCRVSMSL